MKKPIVTIVGRPNVGKSTLFNRLIGYRKAITEDTPGITRDRNYGEFDYAGRDFVLVDTGGFEPTREEGLFPLMREQIITSLEESSMIIFVLDGKEGLIPQDEEISHGLRKYGKPLFYVINKIDSQKREYGSPEFFSLGADKLYPVSSLHGLGIDELLQDLVSEADKALGNKDSVIEKKSLQAGKRRRNQTTKDTEESPDPDTADKGTGGEIRIAVVGRPNTGKSSITNSLLGSQRMIVSEMPGTTRDAVDSKVTFRDRELILIDTAGLRKKSRIEIKIEGYSVSSALRTIEQAHVVNLVIDANEGVSHQDGAIAHLIAARGKGLCIVINKWDLVEGKVGQNDYKERVKQRMPHADFAPVVFTSALTGKNLEGILDTNLRIYSQLNRRIKTSALNKTFQEIFRKQSISFQQGKQITIPYVNQAKSMPPTFILFANYPELIPEHYKRYLENSLREKYGFLGAPIRLVFRKK